jgi:hypothetical protein
MATIVLHSLLQILRNNSDVEDLTLVQRVNALKE